MRSKHEAFLQKSSISCQILLVNKVRGQGALCGLVFLLLTIVNLSCTKKVEDWETYYEKSGCLETPRYAGTMAYCHRLDKASPWVKVTDFGLSAQGNKLPLVIIDKDRNFDPPSYESRKKPVVLIEACIHPGESEGKDAGLMLVRDIVIHQKFPEILNNVTILFIPIFNVDGHERFGPYSRINQNGPKEMGWRTTATNLNLNRDFLKADAPAMRAWVRLFNAWLPDLLADCHTTNGADYQYVMTYSLETHENMTEPVRKWTVDLLMPYLEKNMVESGFPMFPYVSPKKWHNVTSGLTGFAWGPRYSTGYGVVQNRPFLLIETHMLKEYKPRVESTYELLKHLLQIAADETKSLQQAVRQGDRLTAETLAGSELPLKLELTSDSSIIDFKGIGFHIEQSEISGGEWIKYDTTPKDFKIPFFEKVKPTETAVIPYAYLVPPEWHDVIDLLRLHGVKIQRLKEPVTLNVNSYRFSNTSWKEQPYESRHMVEFEQTSLTEERTFPKGTAVIIMNQRTNRVIAHLLEPKGPDSFVAWGFFDGIFQRTEYTEYYVMEKMAREMLAKDEELKKEFEEKLATDTSFAASQRERLYFFYKHTPYWDKTYNLYPVGKVMKEIELPVN